MPSPERHATQMAAAWSWPACVERPGCFPGKSCQCGVKGGCPLPLSNLCGPERRLLVSGRDRGHHKGWGQLLNAYVGTSWGPSTRGCRECTGVSPGREQG